MPHLRVRHLEALLRKSMSFSPIVGVLGHRQVGKTTLTSALADRYVTMDRMADLSLAEHNPESFLEAQAGSPLVIDECQLAPALFPALKERVRTHKKPGQFLLTGSVRFTSRKAIRESLTGRIITWELLPMDLSEAHSAPLPDAIPRLLKAKTAELELPASSYFSETGFQRSLACGGLPGVFALRGDAIRQQRFETQIETLLERDLRLLIETSLSYRSLRILLASLAKRQTEPLELSELSRSTRISPPTIRKLIAALESMFVIRLVETEGTRRKPLIFFEDQGEATHLAGGALDALADFRRFLFANLRPQWIYRPDLGAELSQLRNRGGAFVDFVLRSHGAALGIIPMLDENPDRHALASAASFLRAEKSGKVLFVHRGKKDLALSRTLRVLSVSQLV